MDPQRQCCPTPACPARGVGGGGTIRVHSWPERRDRCARGGRTFAATTGTVCSRRATDPALITRVLTLLGHGCPLQAVVAACGLDERTVADWQAAAGEQCRRVHAHLGEAGQVDLGPVQADALRGKVVGGVVWLATALGGALSAMRDEALLRAVLRRVRAAAAQMRVLVSTDGVRAYPQAIWHAVREPVRTGRRGRPRRVWPGGLLVGPVVKRRERSRVVGIERRAVRGNAAAITARVQATASGADLNTAFSERLNATFPARRVPRSRSRKLLGSKPRSTIWSHCQPESIAGNTASSNWSETRSKGVTSARSLCFPRQTITLKWRSMGLAVHWLASALAAGNCAELLSVCNRLARLTVRTTGW
jgi:hypothetical protein